MVKWMQRFFQYLDRFYVELNQLTSLKDQGYKIFKGTVFLPLQTSIIAAVLEQIEKERNGQLVNKDLIKTTVEIFCYLSQTTLNKEEVSLKKQLENEIVDQTQEFYKQISNQMLASASLSEYLNQAWLFYQQEIERCGTYLTPEVREPLLQRFRQEMLINCQQ